MVQLENNIDIDIYLMNQYNTKTTITQSYMLFILITLFNLNRSPSAQKVANVNKNWIDCNPFAKNIRFLDGCCQSFNAVKAWFQASTKPNDVEGCVGLWGT